MNFYPNDHTDKLTLTIVKIMLVKIVTYVMVAVIMTLVWAKAIDFTKKACDDKPVIVLIDTC